MVVFLICPWLPSNPCQLGVFDMYNLFNAIKILKEKEREIFTIWAMQKVVKPKTTTSDFSSVFYIPFFLYDGVVSL
jgi:hypothetical protein